MRDQSRFNETIKLYFHHYLHNEHATVKIIKISLISRDRKNLQRFAVAIFAQLRRLRDKALRKQTTVKWKDRNAALSLET